MMRELVKFIKKIANKIKNSYNELKVVSVILSITYWIIRIILLFL